MFLKLKNYEVVIKLIGWADGIKEWNRIYKDDTLSLTMFIEGLVLLLIIDAMEGQDAATADIPGDFLQTEYEKGEIHIKM